MLLQITEPLDILETPDIRSVAIGIDLGTTNCVVAYVDKDGKPQTLTLHGKTLTPSVVCLKDGALYVDNTYSEFSFRSTKRLFNNPYQSLNDTTETPLSIATSLIAHLKQQAEETLTTKVTHAVITVPAYFDEPARYATKLAAEKAGLTVLRLIAEPTAAALAYGLEKKVEGIYAIFDLGGGTFDFSLLRLHGEVFQVLATGGDTFLGGDDIDNAICTHCKFSDTQKARELKEKLSDTDHIDIDGHALTRSELTQLSQPFVDRALDVCHNVLRDAALTTSDIEGVVLVGGSTRLQCLQKAVATFFGKPPLTDINPDEVVAHGAALQAHALTVGSDTLLLDVTPLSLGIETMGGLVEKIIPRNTPLPCHMAQDFTTSVDNQVNLSIHILQGESDAVADCRSLGQFILSDIPMMKAYGPRIRVSFQLDVDGLLTVNATELTTGQKQSITLKPTAGLNEEKVKAMFEIIDRN